LKKLLIFTISTGGGHNQAASSLEKEFNLHGYKVVKLDALKETNKTLDSIITNGYKIMANKFPKTYGELYKLTNKENLNSRISCFISYLIKKKISRLIYQHQPDLIIATHPFIVDVVAKLKQKEKINTIFISIITDYDTHQIYVNKNVDAYITGSYYTKESLVKRGIPNKKIYYFGIPVRREFYTSSLSGKRKPDNIFTVLLMGGSIGLNFIDRVLQKLIECKNNMRIITVCGNNESLKNKIEKKYENLENNKEIITYGFTRNIDELMDISNIIITKPGGLTVSEAIIKNLPLIIPFFIPGQEEENARFLVKYNAAIRIKNLNETTELVDKLIENPEILIQMKQNLKVLAKTNSINDIIKLANKLINNNTDSQEIL
jgi:processive 1,2-diacylglycerol beta-glucosyltransferase